MEGIIDRFMNKDFIIGTLMRGPVDQLEDRHLGMVEASGSNPDRSIEQRIVTKWARGVAWYPSSLGCW